MAINASKQCNHNKHSENIVKYLNPIISASSSQELDNNCDNSPVMPSTVVSTATPDSESEPSQLTTTEIGSIGAGKICTDII